MQENIPPRTVGAQYELENSESVEITYIDHDSGQVYLMTLYDDEPSEYVLPFELLSNVVAE